MAILLVHGGLWEDMNADLFWVRPGVVSALRGLGHDVFAPDRMARPRSWQEDVDYLASALPGEPVTVVGGSNGCTVAARLALAFPDSVTGLVLAWPATAGDARLDEIYRAELITQGGDAHVPDALLSGYPLRGLTGADLAGLRPHVAVLPADPVNPFHQRRTVDELLKVIPRAVELAGCPEPPRPEFPPHLQSFARQVDLFTSDLDAT